MNEENMRRFCQALRETRLPKIEGAIGTREGCCALGVYFFDVMKKDEYPSAHAAFNEIAEDLDLSRHDLWDITDFNDNVNEKGIFRSFSEVADCLEISFLNGPRRD